ncbi:MAG TPA: L-threonylcarbamoyladenylate synthase [Pyrinomonadaceae bacterium]|nr:L-threonylcarbamoyladenylate synthase [Pyrinomonadaceae bacterium]
MSESGAHIQGIVPDTVETRERARLVVEAGGVLAFRTDTFYGLGADPFNTAGVHRINRLKEREGRKPVLVVISSMEEAGRFISEKTVLFDELARHYWPGALTIVCKAGAEVTDGITAGSETIGLRVPGDGEVREFIRACGGALTATSANLAGEPPARTALEVARYFPHELDLIVDGGDARTDKPSTVIDATHPHRARLIREGEVERSRLEQSLNTMGVMLE